MKHILFSLLAGAFVSQFISAANAGPVVFPDGFKWCVATAAHQVEGYNTESDMWDWEQVPGHIRNGDKSGAACDHWNRVEQDTELMASLGVTYYRFSVEWAKIEPVEGQFSQAALDHYRAEAATLRAHGIEPLVTLHHFTMPRWLRAKGGWESADAPALFARYTTQVYGAIGASVRDWVTINEPLVHVLGGYVSGEMPPGEKRPIGGIIPVLRGMLRAHAAAYHAIHTLAAQAGREARVGVAHHLRTIDPVESWNPLDRMVASLLETAFNWSFGDAMETGRFKISVLWLANVDEVIPDLKGTQDFVGVNYYTGDLVHFALKGGFALSTRKDLPKNDLGWDDYPQGFARVLGEVGARWKGRPVIITENGTADAQFEDAARSRYLLQHLQVLAQAIAGGLPVEGYCHWSLLDNFEWNQGYFARFGLFETDYATFARKRRPSADLFERIARSNRFEAPDSSL